MRRVAVPTEFTGFQLDVGDQLICALRTIHMDEEIYEDPHRFVMDRFVDGKYKFMKHGKVIPNHFMPFGGGVSMCEGRSVYVFFSRGYSNAD